MPKVSVIMGIYNCAPYLQDALDSLYAQTFKDFEIILCDDGSKDNTYELALDNKKSHPNIVLLKNPNNMGLNKTLNNCLEVAKGEYIARMDGDDVCDPTRFEKEVAFLDEHPEYAIVSTPMIFFDEGGEFMRTKRTGEVVKKDFLKGSPICHAPCMVRREAYVRVGGYSECKRLLRVEDYNLWFKMYAAGYRAYIIDEHLYSMRDDRHAQRRRTWTNRLNEFYVMSSGYKMLSMPLSSYVFSLRPIILGLLPNRLYYYIHRSKYK